VRIVTDERGKRSIEVECPGCGYTWLSTSKSGKTTCPDCRTRVHIPAALRREAYEPTPVFSYGGPDSYDPNEPTDPDGSRREMERVFEEMGPLPQWPGPRTLTQRERQEAGSLTAPEPPARPQPKPPKARRPSTPQAASRQGGWLVGLAAGALMATEVCRALKAAQTPTAARQVPPVGRSPSRSPLALTDAERPSQYVPRPQPTRRTPSRTASSVAKLSCQHAIRLRGRPSELLGGFIECPTCKVNVTVVDAEPAQSPR
jgi:hypothetical protein